MASLGAYADTERECLITIKAEQYGKEGFHPWLMYGDVEAGGETPDQLRKSQREWAKKIVRALFQNFREKGDDDGKIEGSMDFYPTLKSLTLDAKAGTIKAFIIEPFID